MDFHESWNLGGFHEMMQFELRLLLDRKMDALNEDTRVFLRKS